MSHDDSTPETDLDRRLRTLPLEETPPHALKADVRAAIEARVRGAGAGRWWLRVAVLATVFLIGRATADLGRPGRSGSAELPLWTLLLYEGRSFDPGERTGAEMVALYDAWAEDARRRGRFVMAEKLGDERRVEPPATTGSEQANESGPLGELSGFFVVRARDVDEALALARSLPHVRFGGTVVVRSVDPT